MSQRLAMDEKKADHLKSVPPSLTAAIRRARVESAERNQAVADLREAEIGRLQLLEEEIKPVIEQAPGGVDMFDAGIAYGERPRLFIDMIGFVEMAHDRRTYRFLQDTRHGRVLIAETERLDRVVAAVANYIARRLIERERALASDWRSQEGAPFAKRKKRQDSDLPDEEEDDGPSVVDKVLVDPPHGGPAPGMRRSFWSRLGDLFSFLLLVLGSMTFCLGLGLGAYLAWETWGRAAWTAWIGAPPF